MKMNKKLNKNKKSGFTLVELMIVAVIVAIMAAVAIPLMASNTDSAIFSEAKNTLGFISRQLSAVQTSPEYVGIVAGSASESFTEIGGSMVIIEDSDLDGKYFDGAAYMISGVTATAPNSYIITATVKSGYDQEGDNVIMTVLNRIPTFSVVKQ